MIKGAGWYLISGQVMAGVANASDLRELRKAVEGMKREAVAVVGDMVWTEEDIRSMLPLDVGEKEVEGIVAEGVMEFQDPALIGYVTEALQDWVKGKVRGDGKGEQEGEVK